MWKPYAELANNLFPKATQIIDKYHYIRQAIWAFEAVRKQEQSHLSVGYRKYFKRSKSLLTKRFKFLEQEEKQQVNVMLYSSAMLSGAYFLKEKFLSIRDEKDSANAKQLLSK